MSIKGLIERIHLSGKYRLQLNLHGEAILNTLDGRIALSLYRIVQEQLNNIIKHGNPSKINISITCSDTSIDLEILMTVKDLT
jgi:signal transduction histidine kinase